MAQLGAQAAFLSAGGYHHHVGVNTWESAGAPEAPAGTASLRHATVVVPDAAELGRVTDRIAQGGGEVLESDDGAIVVDPSGNRILLAEMSS
jgi:catechol 2,3-dioxygenase